MAHHTELVNLGDRTVVVHSTQDVEPILENNKRLRVTSQKSDWGRHVASIPNVIALKWLNEQWERGNYIRYLSREWDELVSRKLMDPDWKFLRVDK